MLDFGFSEILLTSAIALVVLGPERLPKVARQVGNWMGRARVMARQLSDQLEREVNAEEILKTAIDAGQQRGAAAPVADATLADSARAAPPLCRRTRSGVASAGASSAQGIRRNRPRPPILRIRANE